MPRARTNTSEAAPTRSQRAKPEGVTDDTAQDLEAAVADLPEATGSGHEFSALEDAPEYQRILWYGREGSGKTTDAADAANRAKALGSKVLVINAEAGLKIKALQRAGVDTSAIRLWPDPNKPVQITHRRLDRLFRTLMQDLEADRNAWYAVVFDSASDIVESMVGYVGDKRVAKARDGGVDIDEIDEYATDRNDYGTMGKMFRDILRKYRDLPCHVLLTALERRDEDEDTHRVMYGPAVSPGVQGSLLGYVDIVLATKADDGSNPFRALTAKTARYRAKDRYHILPPVLVEPTFGRILDYYDGVLTEATDPKQALLRSGKKKPATDKKQEDDETDDE